MRRALILNIACVTKINILLDGIYSESRLGISHCIIQKNSVLFKKKKTFFSILYRFKIFINILCRNNYFHHFFVKRIVKILRNVKY